METIMPTVLSVCLTVVCGLIGYHLGKRPSLPKGWQWRHAWDNQTLYLYGNGNEIITTIYKLDHSYWLVDGKRYTSTSRARRAALQGILT